jgi:NCS2 family nucleobase:cation symporter-2
LAKNTDDHALIYQLEGHPHLRTAVPIGLQHVFAMFIGNLAPILVLSGLVNHATGMPIISPDQRMLMIQCCMFASGLATILQLYPIKIANVRWKLRCEIQIGSGLPIVMGTSFGFVPTLSSIGIEYGINVILGSVIAASFIEIFMGLFIKHLKRFFSPIVIGSVLMSIGLYLLPVGVTYFAGGSAVENAYKVRQSLLAQGQEVPANIDGLASQFASWQNLVMGGVVFLIIIILQRFTKGILKVSAMFIAIVAGYILAIILGQINFTAIVNADIIAIPIPYSIKPEFLPGPIIAMAIMVVVSGIETIGHVNGMTMAVWERQAENKETQGALLADFAGNLIAASFNTLPNTSFGQNIGMVSMTKVVNKFCIFITALVLMLSGLSPKIGAALSVMPSSVLGGTVITVFAMIMLNGIKMIAKEGFSERNILILSITFGAGYSIGANRLLVDSLPLVLRYIFINPTVAVFVIAMLLNLIFPQPKEKLIK